MNTKRKIEAQRWFQQASYDLKATRWNIQGGFYDTACFLAQQAGEKALKSLLYFQGARRAALMTHSLVEMIREAGKKATQMKELLDPARELDLHYIPSRYPNGIPSGYPHEFYGQNVAEQAMASAEKILSAVQDYFLAAGEKDILEDQEEKG
jgi:HEPN domain-containing protein